MKFTALLILLSGLGFSAPKLEVSGKSSIDFGKYPAKDVKTTVFTLKNSGDEVLKILNVRKNCSCAEVTVSTKTIDPQKTASVKVSVSGDSLDGVYDKKIFIESNDPDQRFTSLTVSGTAIPIFEVLPKREVSVGRLAIGERWQQFFKLKPTQPGAKLGKPVVECNYPLTASLDSDDKLASLRVKFTPKNSKGLLKGSIKIPVLQPKGWKPIVIKLSGKVGASLSFIPSVIVLPKKIENKIVRKVNFRLSGITNFDEKLLNCSATSVVRVVPSRKEGGQVTLNFEFSKGFAGDISEKGVETLTFSYPGAKDSIIVINRF